MLENQLSSATNKFISVEAKISRWSGLRRTFYIARSPPQPGCMTNRCVQASDHNLAIFGQNGNLHNRC